MLIFTIIGIISVETTEIEPIFYGEYQKSGKLQNFLSPVRNQNQPFQCGASWVFAIASAMSDHFNVIRHVTHQPVTLSPQVLLTCHTPSELKTCDYKDEEFSASIDEIFDNLKKSGIPDETCNMWTSDFVSECTYESHCKWARSRADFREAAKTLQIGYHSYRLRDWNKIVSNDKERISDLFNQVFQSLKQSGPLVCLIRHSADLFKFRQTNIQEYKEENSTDYSTWISIVGLIEDPNNESKDTESKTYLWVIRHSFGETVGRHGYIYLKASEQENSLGLLNNCYSFEVDPQIQYNDNNQEANHKFKSSQAVHFLRDSYNITQPRFEFDQKETNLISLIYYCYSKIYKKNYNNNNNFYQYLDIFNQNKFHF